MCEYCRSYFARYFEGVDGYRIEQWERADFSRVFVPPVMDPERYRGQHGLLTDLFSTSVEHPHDARNAHLESDYSDDGADPLTLGLFEGHHVLLDGYHRCKRFIVSEVRRSIQVYVPVSADEGVYSLTRGCRLSGAKRKSSARSEPFRL